MAPKPPLEAALALARRVASSLGASTSGGARCLAPPPAAWRWPTGGGPVAMAAAPAWPRPPHGAAARAAAAAAAPATASLRPMHGSAAAATLPRSGILAAPGSRRPLHGSTAAAALPPLAPPAAAAAPPAPASLPGPPWPLRLVFLGPPGVGKGTYATRIAHLLGLPHISVGELLRQKVAEGGPAGRRLRDALAGGSLLADELLLPLVWTRLEAGAAAGEPGFVLDGFPRTYAQAAALAPRAPLHAVVNLRLREQALLMKLMGRRLCAECSKGFNVADVRLPAEGAHPPLYLPPLPAPPACEHKLRPRPDDTPAVITRRLHIHAAESAPVEAYYEEAGILMHFEITHGIKPTVPVLLRAILDRAAPGAEPPQVPPHDDPATISTCGLVDREAAAAAGAAAAAAAVAAE